jgi:hypothetical protein
VSQLAQSLTQEELVGWAAYFELHNEQQEKAMEQARMRHGAQGVSRR